MPPVDNVFGTGGFDILRVRLGNDDMRLAYSAAAAMLILSFPAAAEDPSAAPEKAIVLGAGYGLAASDFGYLVVDVADGRVIAELNAGEPFMPASVSKIPTTLAALEILGDDHRFDTTILVEGNIEAGALKGALTLRGGGDPVLTGNDLQALARDITKAGIKQVEAFHYDATGLVDTPQISAMQPEAVGYNPGVSLLSVNFNRIRVKWQNDPKAGPTGAASAQSDGLDVPLGAVHFAASDKALPGRFVRAGQASEDSWLLSPKLAKKGEDWLPVRNPALVAAEMLRELAAKEGVTMPAPKSHAVGPAAKEIARHESIALSDIVRVTLRHSNNMAAELIGLAASRSLAGQPQSLEGSAMALANWWRKTLPTVDWDDFFLENQSGLSSKSRATPRQLVAMLTYAAARPNGIAYRDLLRAASWKAPNGKKVSIRAKTGTIAYGRGLAGYIDATDGRRLAFAVFFNDLKKRAALDAAFDPRVESPETEGRPWRNRALRMEQMLLNGWATGSWK
jgi:D-alanyl-D-alanine carboxypeptidase/D-alanyl-D-alanine-endopeptidase (penicillin-binding protein 4)